MNSRVWYQYNEENRTNTILTFLNWFCKQILIQRKNLKMNVSENLKRFRDFSSGSECDVGSENVIILTIRFFKVITGFK